LNTNTALKSTKFLEFLERLPLQKGSGHLRRLMEGYVVGDWLGCELSSVFQPIFETGDVRKQVGLEAFLRCLGRNSFALSPWSLFSADTDDDQVVALDRLARTLHTLNFLASTAGDSEERLFLNVHGRLLASVAQDHGKAFRRVLDALDWSPSSIVIETPIEATAQIDLLTFVLRNYRNNGFRVAINLASLAQWEGVQALPVDFIKIDSRPLVGGSDQLERFFDLESDNRALVRFILTRVENGLSDRLPPGLWAQGHDLGWPAPLLIPERHCGRA
jgi:EAL domain-containing protein (putative c-di-GMP-specific phosphodiesterase class I)